MASGATPHFSGILLDTKNYSLLIQVLLEQDRLIPPKILKIIQNISKQKKTPISVSLAIKDARLHKTAAGGEGGSRVFPLLLTLAKEC